MIIIAFSILYIVFYFFLYIKIEKLIDDIIYHKAKNIEKSFLVSWITVGVLLIFHISELYSLKKKYLRENDFGLIAEYKRVMLYYWILLVWFATIILYENISHY